jgi:hypothetical protein
MSRSVAQSVLTFLRTVRLTGANPCSRLMEGVPTWLELSGSPVGGMGGKGVASDE